jgi:hypothetical protein
VKIGGDIPNEGHSEKRGDIPSCGEKGRLEHRVKKGRS